MVTAYRAASEATESTTISVVLVDDHSLMRQGIRSALEIDGKIVIVGEAWDEASALAQVQENHPDVLLMDIRLGEQSGLNVSRRVIHVAPKTKILVLSAYDDNQYVKGFLHLGVHGYLLKTVSSAELAWAVRYIAQGGVVFPPTISSAVLNCMTSRDENQGHRMLTNREVRVLSQMCKGLRNHDIAQLLGVSVRTIEVHVEHILFKLGVSNRTQAALKAIGGGLLEAAAEGDTNSLCEKAHEHFA